MAARGGFNRLIAHSLRSEIKTPLIYHALRTDCNSLKKITILRRNKLCYHPSVTGHFRSGLARFAPLDSTADNLKSIDAGCQPI